MPTGTPRATTSMRAPQLSPCFLSSSTNASMRAMSLALAAKNGLSATWCQPSKGIAMSPIALRWPKKLVPQCSRSHFFAIAAAPTAGAVSRADARPPPRGSRRPY